MKCCVNSCKNNAKRGPKTQGISFHKLPRDPLSRTRWLSALGTPRKVKGKTVVCGEHFCSEDLCLGENGEVSVREGAVPKVSENGDPVNVKICGVCLGTDIKLYDLHMPSLSQAYETLTNIPVGSVASVGAQACALCARRLLNHSRLRTAALSAQQLLTETLAACQQVTPQHIEELDSAEHQLLPKLSFKHYEPLCFDAHSHENDGLNPLRSYSKSTIPLHEVNINIDAKADDSKDFLQENNDTQDSIKSEVDSLRNSDENPIADIDENGHFSSDDDRPILEQKVKRKLVKSAKSKVVTAKQTKKTILNKEPKIDRRKKLLGDDLDEKIFASSQLNSEEQIAEFQKRIQSSNYKNAVYKCTYCFKGFLDEDAYNNHMVRHTDQCGVHECEICKIRFKQPHALRNHVTSHMQKFTCKCCPYVTFRKQTAKLHEEWHNGTKYQCPHCQEEFLKFTTYMGHVRIKHPSDSVCPLCGCSFVSDKGLRLHRKLKHRLDDDSVIPECGPFCERCGVRFLSAEAHQKHLQVSARHADAVDDEAKEVPQRKQRKPREIKNNTKEVVEMDAKKKKKRPPTVKPEGPIPCEQCNAQLEDSRAYYKHFRRAHPDKNRTNYPSMKSPCMCERCGRMFQTLALLVDHAHVHSSEKRFKCSLCSKTFQQKQRLVAHAHIHSAQRAVYVCGVCGKHFSTHSNRQRHMFSHTGLKPFKCEMCGKCFKHASEKRAHVGYVHLKKPWPKRARHKRPRDLYEAPPTHREPQRDMEIVDPLWPPCADPKLGPHLLPDKPVYYNLKM